MPENVTALFAALINIEPELYTAPPDADALLSVNTASARVIEPALYTAPPFTAVFSLNTADEPSSNIIDESL